MSWLELFLRRRLQTELVEAAHTIAVRRRISIWERVQDTVTTMSTNEARGYIRARAATIVHAEVDKVIARHDLLTEAHRAQLLAATFDAVIADTLVERNRQRAAATPLSRAA